MTLTYFLLVVDRAMDQAQAWNESSSSNQLTHLHNWTIQSADTTKVIIFGLSKIIIWSIQPAVDFINCFAPYVYLLRIAMNFCACKKLLKSWA